MPKANSTGQVKMTTINLYQNKEENERKVSLQSANSGFFFSLGILIITLLVLFGLKFYIPILESENNALAQSIADENAKLVGLKDLEHIVDTQNRLSEIKDNLKVSNSEVTRTEMTQILDKLSLDINKNIVISDYGYGENNVTVSFVANNFNDASKQIFNFKKSSYFKDVVVSSISRDGNTVSCKIEMKIAG